jgi:hypothetical protein
MKVGHSSDLLNLQAFEEKDYDAIALTSLTAYSAYWLSQWGLQTSLENLAVLNFKMFPAKFAMVGWPQFPDFNRTSRSVLQMRPKYRNFATSITKDGVFLNDFGSREALALTNRIGSPKFQDGSSPLVEAGTPSARGVSRPRTIHPEDQLAKIRKSRMFQLYDGEKWMEAEAIDLVNFLEVYDHTPSKEKIRRLKEFQQAAEQLADEQILAFLHEVETRFRAYLHK